MMFPYSLIEHLLPKKLPGKLAKSSKKKKEAKK